MKKLIFILLTLVSFTAGGQNLTPIVQPLIMPKLIVSPDKRDSVIITYSSARHDSIYFWANKPFSIKGFKGSGGTYFAGYGLRLSVSNVFSIDTGLLATQWDLQRKADTIWVLNKLNGGTPISLTISNNTTASIILGDTSKEYFGSYTITRDTNKRYGRMFIRVVNHKLLYDLGDYTQNADLGVRVNGFTLTGNTIYLNYTTTNTGKTAKLIYRPMGGVSAFSMVYPPLGIGNSTGSSWDLSFSSTNKIPANYISILNQNTTGTAAGLTSQYIDWNILTGGASVANKPVIPQTSTSVSHNWLKSYDASTGLFTKSTIDISDITSFPTIASSMPNVSHKWLNSYDASTGSFTQTQIYYSDLLSPPSIPVSRTAYDVGLGFIAYNGRTKAPGQFNGGYGITNDPPNDLSHILNFNGLFYSSILSASTIQTSDYQIGEYGSGSADIHIKSPDLTNLMFYDANIPSGISLSQLANPSVPVSRTAGDAGVGYIKYNGTSSATGQFYGGNSDPSMNTILNYNGNFRSTILTATNSEGYSVVASGPSGIYSGGNVVALGGMTSSSFNSNASQTTVNGSVGGSITCSMPLNGSSFKEVIVYCSSIYGSATYSFPTPFSHRPDRLGEMSSSVSAVSTTSVTINSGGSSGYLILYGY